MAAIPEPWAACGWSMDGQRSRFVSVLEYLDLRIGDVVLDWGCGTGELSELLPGNVSYVGYDTAPGMIKRARRDHPARRFTSAEPTSADVTVCIGALNLSDRWSKALTWATLRRLWDKTSRVLAVCLYAGEDDRCLIYTEDEVEVFAQAESFYWSVDRHRENDLLMVLRK